MLSKLKVTFIIALYLLSFECNAINPPINRFIIILLATTIPYELYNKGTPSTYEIQYFSTGAALTLVAFHQAENQEIRSVISTAVDLVFLKMGIDLAANMFIGGMYTSKSFNYWFLSGVGLIEIIMILRKIYPG